MKLTPQVRGAELAPVEDKRFSLSFSSTEPYERGWGWEILDHSPGAIDMTRLERGAPVLFNHDPNVVIGVVEKAWVDGNRARAVIRIGESAKAQEVLTDIQAGVLRNVSVGYQIQEMVKEGSRDGVNVYRVTKWQPFEVSVVSIPADTTVGIGRAFDAENDVTIIERSNSMTNEPNNKPAEPNVDVRVIETEARAAERKRISEIQAIGERVGMTDLARQFIENGRSVDEFRAAVLEQFDARPKVQTKAADELGLSEKERRRFSLLRAIQALANPGNRKLQDAARFEFEVSEEAQKRSGVQAQGILIPFEVLNRALTSTGSDTGSSTVATELMASDFIELLRNRSAVLERATIMQGLVGNVAIPRQIGATTAAALSETGATTASDLALDQVTLSPRRVGAASAYSKQLLAQSSLDVESLIINDIVRQVALKIDAACIVGTGTNEPTGLLNATGVNIVSIGANGGPLTWAHVVQMEALVEAANVDPENGAYVVNAKTNGYLKTKPKEAGTAVYLVEDGIMNGYPVVVSNQMPSNLTKGTGTNLSALAFGNWSDVLIGFWGGIDITVDPYTAKSNGLVEIQADQFYDMALRHPESFSVIKDAAV